MADTTASNESYIQRTSSGLSKTFGPYKTTSKAKGFLSCGYHGKDVPRAYQITVTDRRPAEYANDAGGYNLVTVRALMQGPIETSVRGHWQASTASYLSSLVNQGVQALTGSAAQNTYVSRRIWSGTSPLSLVLKLLFVAMDDPIKDVYQPVVELQRMVLPYLNLSVGGLAFKPPGPNPYTTSFTQALPKMLTWFVRGINQEGEDISIQIGQFIDLQRVVVHEVDVAWDDKFTKDGVPVAATVSLRFETFEVLTKNSLDSDMYAGINTGA
jgi:hypothetical protein